VWNVPSHHNPYFAGRELVLAELTARLTTPETTSRRVALTGLGGVGKTQLAVEYAYRHRADYDLVWWVRGEQPTSLLGDYAVLAVQHPLAADLDLREGGPQEAVVAQVRGWLELHRRWLLVLDNVEEPQAVADLLPRSATGHVLLTSRADTGWEPLADPLPVEVLGPTDAAAFLLARTKQEGPLAEAAATTLASLLGGLPLALEQAAAYIVASGTVTLADYAELFATRALELLKRGQPLGYHHTVATTWSLALQRLQQADPAAVGLLTLAAFLASDDLPQALLGAHDGEPPAALAAVVGDPLALGDAVAALRRHSLVRVVADGLFVHRLLQTVVRSSLDAEAERTWTSVAVLLLRAAFPDDINEVAVWPVCDRLLPHVLVVADHAQRLDVEPEARLWLLSQAAMYLWRRGWYRQALTLQERALAGYRRVFGDDHPDTLRSIDNLAETRLALGDLRGTRKLSEQSLAGFRRVFGDDHPDTLHSMNNLAATLRDLGDLQRARELHERALATYRRVLGDEHPDTLWSMSNLAVALRDLGDLRDACDLQEQALVGFRRMIGDDHPDTLTSMNNLAETLAELEDLQGARELHEQTLAARRRVLGDDHPDTLTSMSNLDAVRRELGEL
jgi:tetratricopeptide (TPR) repeat protein